MARDGQGCRDYGVHLKPETNWKMYDTCKCGAEQGEACIDRRFKHSAPKKNWTPHPNRPVISVLDGRVVVGKMGQ